MASPFTVFRRNQKVLLAITGILAMIAFVFIGPTCMQMGGTVGRGENPAVLSWNYGTIHEGDMLSRMQTRRLLNQFLREAALLAGEPLPQGYQHFDISEQGIVNGMVLTQLGKDLGLVVSDDTVNMKLAQWTGNRVRPGDLEQIIARLGQQRVSSQQIFEGLRQEYLADHVHQLWLGGWGIDPILRRGEFSLDPPEQRWENFRRLEQSIVAQVMPVPVAESTGDVAEPAESELREFFNRYKDREPLPGSPEPGFRQPYRAKFQYFKAEMESFLEAAMLQITEEQISEYYEKNKDNLFRASKLPAIDEKNDDDANGDQTKRDETKSDGTKRDEIESSEKNPGQEAPETKLPAESGKEPTEDSPSQPDGAETESKDAQPSTAPEPADETKASSPEAPASDKSARIGAGPFRLVNFQDEAESASEPAKADEPAPPAAADKPNDKKQTDDKPNDDKPVSNDPQKGAGETSAPTDEQKPAAEVTAEETGDKSEATQANGTAAKPIEYRPLDKVRDEIRRTLGRQRVAELMQERLDKLRIRMTDYSKSRTNWMIERTSDADLPPPKPLNFEVLAQDNRVKAFTTDFLSRVGAITDKNLDIARSFDRAAWTAAAFEPGGLFRPSTSMDVEGNRFLWWKTDEREGRIPDFEEVKEEVLDAYKMIHARDKAVARARQHAKQVNDAKKNMKDLFADDKDLPVTETAPFTWLTTGNVPMGMGQLRMSEVKGVEMAGEEFMRKAYSLEPGETGVALNAPKTVAYVIQVIKTDPSLLVLQKDFMARIKSYDRFRMAASDDLTGDRQRWLDSLYEKYGVHWERPAQQPRASVE